MAIFISIEYNNEEINVTYLVCLWYRGVIVKKMTDEDDLIIHSQWINWRNKCWMITLTFFLNIFTENKTRSYIYCVRVFRFIVLRTMRKSEVFMPDLVIIRLKY